MGAKMPDADPYDLARFVAAQEPVFAGALRELEAGRKRGHWMWFIFPQLRGLGSSTMADFYGIGSLNEARAYLAHPLLGPRIALCTSAVLAIETQSLNAVFGSPDDLKFCSSMTLFAFAANDSVSPYRQALVRYCNGQSDPRTSARLGRQTD